MFVMIDVRLDYTGMCYGEHSIGGVGYFRIIIRRDLDNCPRRMEAPLI